MTTTVTKRINGTWSLVASGSPGVTLFATPFAYEVFVGSGVPAETEKGIPCNDETGVCSLSSLAGSDNVYVRLRALVGNDAVVVMAS